MSNLLISNRGVDKYKFRFNMGLVDKNLRVTSMILKLLKGKD